MGEKSGRFEEGGMEEGGPGGFGEAPGAREGSEELDEFLHKINIMEIVEF